MGNANSFDGSMCSCISPEEKNCTLDDNIHIDTLLISTADRKRNKYQATLLAHEHEHVKFLQKGRTFTYSLSSMSSSSLNSKAAFSDERRGERARSRSRGTQLRSNQPSIFDTETRNDSEQEHCQNRSEDELRVTQSSYDEETTEALSQYYSNRAAYDGRVVKRVSIARNNLEQREVCE